MNTFDEYVNLDLYDVNGQLWALNNRDGDEQISLEGWMSNSKNAKDREYKVKWIGEIKIPLKYIEEYKETGEWHV